MPLLARKSGYVQTVHPELLLPVASEAGVTICLRARVGQHVVAGTALGWVWAPTADDPRPAAEPFEEAVHADVRIGFERTLEQDVAFGIRQQIDIASKALSAAINDPYTAVQAINHLTVVCCELAVRPLGADVLTDPPVAAGWSCRATPSRTTCSSSRGWSGATAPTTYTVMAALSRLIRSCAEVLPPGLGPAHPVAPGRRRHPGRRQAGHGAGQRRGEHSPDDRVPAGQDHRQADGHRLKRS